MWVLFVFIIILVALLVWGLIFIKRKRLVSGTHRYALPHFHYPWLLQLSGTNHPLSCRCAYRHDEIRDNAISLVSYIQREQFGSQPLLFGPDFDKRPIDYKVSGKRYIRSTKNGKDVYEEVGNKIEPVFAPEDKRFFPRIWDYNDAGHINFYRSYLGLDQNEAPSASDNFNYFFNYQINWMWWRYFMWNYAGRQNDIEGQGDPKNGNWISGIGLIDNTMRGLGDIDGKKCRGL